MHVRRFLDRLAAGTPAERADIVRALVRVYLTAPLDAQNRTAARTALTAILDDPAPRVRRAMAEAFAESENAPRTIVVPLANDQADVAEILLARSPMLREGELVDIAATGDVRHQTAIASRPEVGVGLSAALVEVSEAGPCARLLRNPGATIAASTFRRLVERHRRDPHIRNALLQRDDLSVTLRQSLLDGLSEALADLVRERAWLTPARTDKMLADAGERAVVELAAASRRDDLVPLVEQLACEGRLTIGLVLRAACSGNLRLFELTMARLSGVPERRVASLIHHTGGSAVAALYRRSGLPQQAFPAFRGVVEALREHQEDGTAAGERGLRSRMIERALTHHQVFSEGETDEFFAFLCRLSAEAAREEAREETGGYFRAA